MKFNLIFGSETGTARGLIGQLSNQILALNSESTEQIEIERFSMEEFVKVSKLEIFKFIFINKNF
jgi:hypothetical protein